jgi:hypothetical protein
LFYHRWSFGLPGSNVAERISSGSWQVHRAVQRYTAKTDKSMKTG